MNFLEVNNIDSKIIRKLVGKVVCKFYVLTKLIGEGSFGTVYEAVHLSTKELAAVKVIGRDQMIRIPELTYLIPNEIAAIKSINCPNVIRYLGDEQTETNIYIVMEYCEGGDLARVLQQKLRLDEATSLEYLCQILNAFKAMHEHNIMHRDLKLENIMIKQGILKIVDFGFAKIFKKDQQLSMQITETVLGSPAYMAPEILEGKPYGIQAEIYSLGVILYWTLFGNAPYLYKNRMNPDDNELAGQIKLGKLPLTKANVSISQDMERLLTRMLEYDLQKRITFQELFQEQIIRNVWAIDQTRGDGRLGLPKNVEQIQFEERKDYVQLNQSSKKIKLLQPEQQQNQTEETMKLLINSSSKIQVRSRTAFKFILENYQYDENINSQLAKTIFLIQNSEYCFVKSREKAFLCMLKYLIHRANRLYEGYSQNQNIYEFKDFKSLLAHEGYQNLKQQFELNTYQIVCDHQMFGFNELLQAESDKSVKVMLQKDYNEKEMEEEFLIKYGKIMKEYYEEVNQFVADAILSKFKQQKKQQLLLLQLRVLVAIDLKKIFPAGFQNNAFTDFDNKILQALDPNKGIEEMQNFIKDLEKKLIS